MKYEYRYFRKGLKSHTRPDVIVELKRPDIKDLENFTDEELANMKAHIRKELKPVLEEMLNLLTGFVKPNEMTNLIGKKCKAFEFKDKEFGQLVFHPDMEIRIGEIGQLSDFNPDTNTFKLLFSDGDYWNYPADLVLQNLV